MLQGIVPFDEIKKGECMGESVPDKPLSQLLCVSRDLIRLDIEDVGVPCGVGSENPPSNNHWPLGIIEDAIRLLPQFFMGFLGKCELQKGTRPKSPAKSG